MKNRKQLADTIRAAIQSQTSGLTVGEVEDNAPSDRTGFSGLTIKDEEGTEFFLHVYDGEAAQRPAVGQRQTA